MIYIYIYTERERLGKKQFVPIYSTHASLFKPTQDELKSHDRHRRVSSEAETEDVDDGKPWSSFAPSIDGKTYGIC